MAARANSTYFMVCSAELTIIFKEVVQEDAAMHDRCSFVVEC